MATLRDLVAEIGHSLRAHAPRFMLTASGVAWGALMLTFATASTRGLERHFIHEFEELGPDLVFFGGGRVVRERVGARGARTVELEAEDVERVRALPAVRGATPVVDLGVRIVRAQGRTRLLRVEGVDETAAEMRNLTLARGRFLDARDVAQRARVAAIGPEVATRMFGSPDAAVGRFLQLESLRMRVVGVSNPRGDQLINPGDPEDMKIWVPFTTAQRWVLRDDRVHEVLFAPTNARESRAAVRRVRETTSLHHSFHPDNEPALWVFDTHDALDPIVASIDALSLFARAAGIVTLFVGAVGVMNVMLVVAGERRREIGLRKALGATTNEIFLQFLLESLCIAAASAAVGAGLGLALVAVVGRVSPPGSPLHAVSITDPGLAATMAATLAFVGVIAGVAPAMRAAGTAPADALRSP